MSLLKNPIVYCYSDPSSPSFYEVGEEVTLVDGEATVLATHWQKDEGWSKRVAGTIAAELNDTGNGVTVAFPNGGPSITLGYDQVSVLQCLVDYYFKHLPQNYAPLHKFKEVD